MRRSAERVFLLLLLAAGAAAQAVERYAVVVGNNAGSDFRRALRFAESDAVKVDQVLEELGGFPKSHVRLLLGRTADQVRDSLLGVEAELEAVKARGEQSLLVFFYSGHADGERLELGDTGLRFDEVVHWLKTSSAGVRVAIIDSCQSGRMVASKGVSRGPAYPLIRMGGDLRSSGYVIMTSSAHEELSQESAELRGSFFTHAVVSALRGAGDRSQDGAVTVEEAYAFAYERTVARTGTGVGGTQHPLYDFQLKGRGDVVLTETRTANARLTVTSPTAGRLLVLTSAQDRVLAEGQLEPGQAVTLALVPGSYLGFFVTENELRRAVVQLTEGSPLALDTTRDFAVQPVSRAVAKGGLFRTDWGGEVGAGLIARRFPLGEQLASFGGAVSLRLFHPDGPFFVARVTGLAAPNVGAATGFHEVGVGVGGGYRLSWSDFELRGQALVELDYTGLSPTDSRARASLGPSYGLELALVAPLPQSLTVSLAAGVGGRLLFFRAEGVVHQLDAHVSLMIGRTWD